MQHNRNVFLLNFQNSFDEVTICGDYTYDKFRASYLSHIAQKLGKSGIVGDMKLEYHHDNYLKPIIVITSSGINV